MADPSILPGDRVVDLSASLRFAALVSGGISCAISLWIVKENVLWSIAALVAGAVAGFCVGLVLGPTVYPAPSGRVAIVKVGPEALGSTLKAGLIGAIVSGAIAAAAPAIVFAQASKVVAVLGVGIGVGVVVGGVVGYLASK